MKVLGNRVYVDVPDMPETKVIVDPQLKKEMQLEMAKQFEKLTVFAVGKGVQDVKVGDKIYIRPELINKAPVVEIEGKERLEFSEYEVSFIW